MRHSVITATGSYIPEIRVPNEAFLTHHFFEDYGRPFEPELTPKIIEKFREITDIEERRWVTDDLVASDIGHMAADTALQSGTIDPETLDAVIVAHNFGDVLMDNRHIDLVPTLAARIKQKLGISNPECIACDLPFGCPGWLQGLIQADHALRLGEARRILVVAAETLSRISDPHDRDSMLYSDGAGAAVLEAVESDEPLGLLAAAARSDTVDHARLLWMGESYNPDYPSRTLFLKMHGRTLYEYALTHVPALVKKSLDRAGLGLHDVSKILLHQANAKMDEAILKRLFRLYGEREIPEGVMPMSINKLGNSSVATIPTLLDLIVTGRLEGQSINSGDVVVLASVGAGMNINSLVYRWA